MDMTFHHETMTDQLGLLPVEGIHQSLLPDELSSQLGLPSVPTVSSFDISTYPQSPSNTAHAMLSSVAFEVPPAKPLHSERWQVPDAKWEEHKETLYRLYIVDGLTLEKTMSVMENYHGFQASKRMYKDRFNSWGMFKNLRKGDVKDVARQLKERQSCDSEVLISGKKISKARVQRYLAKHGESIPERANVTVRTLEANNVGSPTTMGTTAGTAPSDPYLAVDVKHPFDVQSFRLEGRGLSFSELSTLEAAAAKHQSDGQLDEAISSLRTALIGWRDIYTPTHPKVQETAWCLVEVYALNQEIQRVDEVINWMSRGYSQDLSLWHPVTLAHYLKVLLKLQKFGRSDDARSLGFRLFTAIRDKVPSTMIIPVYHSPKHNENTDHVVDDAEFQHIFDERSDADEIEQQLTLACIWIEARFPGMKSVVQKLISRFESLPSDLRGWEAGARCMYTEILLHEEDHETARSECNIVQDSLAKLIRHVKPEHFEDFINVSRHLVGLQTRLEGSSGRERVLSWVTHVLGDRILELAEGTDGGDNALAMVDCFTEAGLRHQRGHRQDLARTSFRWAHCVSVKLLGSDNLTSQRLERASKDGYYDDRDDDSDGDSDDYSDGDSDSDSDDYSGVLSGE